MSRAAEVEQSFQHILTDQDYTGAFLGFLDEVIEAPPTLQDMATHLGDRGSSLVIAAHHRSRMVKARSREAVIPYFLDAYGLQVAADNEGFQAINFSRRRIMPATYYPVGALSKLALAGFTQRELQEGKTEVQAYQEADRVLIGNGFYTDQDPMPQIGYGTILPAEDRILALAADEMQASPAIQAETIASYPQLLPEDETTRQQLAGHEFAAYHNQVAVSVAIGALLSGPEAPVILPNPSNIAEAGMNIHW